MAELPLPQVQASAAPTGRYATPGTVPLQDQRGAQLNAFGRAMVGAGAQAMDVGEAQHRDYVGALAREADSLFSDQVRQADTQFLQLTGKAAIDGREAADKALQEQLDKVGETLQDEDARDLFDQAAEKRRQWAMARWDRHQGDQRTAYEVGQLDAATKAAVEDHRRFFGTEQAGSARDLALGNVDRMAEKMGAPPAVRDRMRLEVTTSMHEGVLKDLVAQQRSSEAAAYLKQHQGEMSGNARARAREVVTRAVVDRDSRALAAQIVADHQEGEVVPPPVASTTVAGVDLEVRTWDEEQRAAGRPMPPREEQRGEPPAVLLQTYARQRLDAAADRGDISPELRAATLSHVANLAQERRQAVAVATNQVMTNAEAWLQAHPLAGVQELPPQLYTAVAAAGKLGELNSFARSGRYVSAPKDFAAMQQLLRSDADLRSTTPEQLVSEWRGRLDTGDLNELLAAKRKADGKASKADETALASKQRIVEGFHAATKIPRDRELTDAEQLDLYRWRERVQKLIDGEPVPAEVPPQRLQQLLDQAALDRVIERRVSPLFGVDALAGDVERLSALLTDEQRRNAYVPPSGIPGATEPVMLRDIPKDVRTQLELAAQDEGVFASEAQIVRMWVRRGRPQSAADVKR